MSGYDQLNCIGNRVRQYRKDKCFSMQDLAEHCRLSINTISLIERGKVSPNVTTLIRISEALEISASLLFNDCSPSRAFVIPSHASGFMNQLDHFARFATRNESWQTGEGMKNRQMCLCINGRVEYMAHDQSVFLKPGDSLSFCGEALHRWINSTCHTGVIILVIPPSCSHTKITEVLDVSK